MILVDTSVFVDWLKGNENQKTKIFDKILNTSTPFSISVLTYHEILQGAKNDEEYEMLRVYFSTQSICHLPADLDFFDGASALCRRIRPGRRAASSTVDSMIAMTAIHHQMKLLHNNDIYDALAKEISELDILES